LLLNQEIGSFFFLAALLTDVELSSDSLFESSHCGTCTACLDACPTNAFPEPHVLNASRCISYLTIEHRGEIAPELCDQMQNWVFGCDVCQIVCPWNRKRAPSVLSQLQHQDMGNKTSLLHWLSIDELEFRRLYKKTPFWRTKLDGMRRNALIAAANSNRQDLRPMIEPFLHSENEVLRATSRWSLEKLDKLHGVNPQEIS
jgi:epoxyqueuosine reductase